MVPASPSSLFASTETSYGSKRFDCETEGICSSVKYGRMAYFAIEINDRKKAVETAI